MRFWIWTIDWKSYSKTIDVYKRQAYKGPDAEKEMGQAEKAIKILGGKLRRIEAVNLVDFDHNIIVIEKIKETPAKYPRKAGTPAKEPIN